jgi:anti-sigma B factor antagonist
MQLVHRSDGDILIIEVLEPRLAAGAAKDFGERLAQMVAQGHRRIVLNLDRVRFIDSSGLGMIVMVQRRLLDGGEITIVNAQVAVLNILKLTRMNQIFRIFPDEAAAVEALKKGEDPPGRDENAAS